MYNIPTPERYRDIWNKTQEAIMSDFMNKVSKSLLEGKNQLVFTFPDELHISYRDKARDAFEEVGWTVGRTGLGIDHLRLLI